VDPDDFSIWVRTGHHVPPSSRGGTQIFSLGMMVINAEPPFQRTKIAVIVDKYILLNTMDFNIEIKQGTHLTTYLLTHLTTYLLTHPTTSYSLT
jgi:hypothetical protein